MSFPDTAQAENDPTTAGGRPGLIGVRDDAWVKQGGGLERVLVQEIGAHETALRDAKDGVRFQRRIDLGGARIHHFEQIAMAAREEFEDLRQLRGRYVGGQRHNPVDDMVYARFVDWIAVPRFGS